MDVTIYHNPSCSKSRATLELLRDRGVEPAIVAYLDDPPTADRVRDLARMLGSRVLDIVRTAEPAFTGMDNASDDELAEAVAASPVLLQRPIVVVDGRAAIGRPPQAILDLIGDAPGADGR